MNHQKLKQLLFQNHLEMPFHQLKNNFIIKFNSSKDTNITSNIIEDWLIIRDDAHVYEFECWLDRKNLMSHQEVWWNPKILPEANFSSGGQVEKRFPEPFSTPLSLRNTLFTDLCTYACFTFYLTRINSYVCLPGMQKPFLLSRKYNETRSLFQFFISLSNLKKNCVNISEAHNILDYSYNDNNIFLTT